MIYFLYFSENYEIYHVLTSEWLVKVEEACAKNCFPIWSWFLRNLKSVFWTYSTSKLGRTRGQHRDFEIPEMSFAFCDIKASLHFSWCKMKHCHHYLPVCLSFFAQSLCHHRGVSCFRCFLKFPTRPTLKDETLPNHQQPKKFKKSEIANFGHINCGNRLTTGHH